LLTATFKDLHIENSKNFVPMVGRRKVAVPSILIEYCTSL